MTGWGTLAKGAMLTAAGKWEFPLLSLISVLHPSSHSSPVSLSSSSLISVRSKASLALIGPHRVGTKNGELTQEDFGGGRLERMLFMMAGH